MIKMLLHDLVDMCDTTTTVFLSQVRHSTMLFFDVVVGACHQLSKEEKYGASTGAGASTNTVLAIFFGHTSTPVAGQEVGLIRVAD